MRSKLSIGVGARPIEVHVGGYYAAGKRHRAITREQALADGIRACIHCQPETELGGAVNISPARYRPSGASKISTVLSPHFRCATTEWLLAPDVV
ncbi:DUF6233 domain-containing protein [Streptomyces sp. NPDC005134]|uniref:DUF6233 domain-containing protein n=1 Tax=Streptomyces sp. NPDC005098 TaxID=3154560 RepID=UPI0033B66981